jgi:hypothetical protein
MEVKLLDALFAASVAPYNRALSAARPFEAPPFNDQPRALAKFLHVTQQRAVANNAVAQAYFAARSARVWTPKGGAAAKSDQGVVAPPLLLGSSGGAAGPHTRTTTVRAWALWRDIIIAQGEDPLGATVTLAQLLSSSELIVKKLVNNELLDRFKVRWSPSACALFLSLSLFFSLSFSLSFFLSFFLSLSLFLTHLRLFVTHHSRIFFFHCAKIRKLRACCCGAARSRGCSTCSRPSASWRGSRRGPTKKCASGGFG